MVVIIILVIVLVGVWLGNYISKGGDKLRKEQDDMIEELFAQHNENYEKWEKEYTDFFRTVSQCYDWDKTDNEFCIYPNGGKMYNVPYCVKWEEILPDEIKRKYCFASFYPGCYYPGNVAYNKEEIVVFRIYDVFVRENNMQSILYTIESKETGFYKENKIAIINSVLYDKDGNFKHYQPFKYKISDIKFFKESGSIETLTNVSGGGGGGYDLRGAIVGGLIAGDAGAIIGSRKEINPVQTTYETKDNRITMIFFNDGRKLNISGISLYEWLMDIIPEKEYNAYIQNLNKSSDNLFTNNNQVFMANNQNEILYKCVNCGNTLKSNDNFCSKCGTEYKFNKIIHCPKCQNKLETNDKFCSNCGYQINL